GNELETDRLDLAAEHAFFDAMERLSDRGTVAGPRRMVGDHQHAAGLERRVELAIHLGAVDLHIGRVVVKEKERDEGEIARVGGPWKGRASATTFGIAGVFMRASKRSFARAPRSAAFWA